MILPNKLITFKESVLAKTVIILDEVATHDIKASELYDRVKDKFEDLNQYIIALDVLFALEKIKINAEARTIEYVESNIM
ncbi:MAG: hypothetical protein RR444_11480 [Oscillospiraceae bacterium]